MRYLLMIVFAGAALTSPLRADVAVWNGGIGNWGQAGLWSGGTVPNNSGNTTYDVTIDGKSAAASTVQLTIFYPTVAVRNLSINANDTMTMSSVASLTASNLNLAGTLSVSAGTLLFAPNGDNAFGSGTILLNGGTIGSTNNSAWYFGSGVRLLGNGTLNNLGNNYGTIGSTASGKQLAVNLTAAAFSYGTFAATGGGYLSLTSGTLTNYGTLAAVGTGSQLTISSGATLKNAVGGKIVADGGSVYLFSPFALSRDDEVSAINGGNVYFNTLTTAGHTLAGNAGGSFSIGTLNNNGGTISSSGTLVFGNATNVGGRILISGGGTSIANGNATIDNSGGTISVSNGVLALENLNTLSGGTFTSSNGGALSLSGAFSYSGGTVRDLTNTGTINVGNNGNVAGTIVNNGRLNFGTGYQNFAVGTVAFSGSGTASLAYCNADAAYSAGSGSVTFVNGLSHTISGYGNFFYVSGGTPKTVLNRGLMESTPAGTAAAGLALGGNRFVNEATGTLRALTNSTLSVRTDDFTSLGTIDVFPGANFSVVSSNGGTASLASIFNAGTVILQQTAGTLSSVSGGTLSVRNYGTFTLGQMNVAWFGNNGTVNLAAGSATAVKTKGYSISELNLNDRAMLIDYDGTSPLSDLTAKVKKGYAAAAGRWKGAAGAIFSDLAAADPNRRALGIADLSALYGNNVPMTLLGQSVDVTTVAIRFTYAGDANLDGKVDVSDLGRLASRWQQADGWTGGDFNYDGLVDVADLGILATTWQLGVTNPTIGFAEALVSVNLPDANSLPGALVAAGLLRRRPRDGSEV